MSKRILIIDDDPFITALYEAKLQKEGLDAAVAGDGEAALRKLQEFLPDILLLDLQMPKLNGIQVLTYVRAHPKLKNIPVIIFSNAATDNLVKQAWDAGATKFLTKNQCSPNDLVIEVRHTLAENSPAPQQALSEVTPVKSYDWPTERLIRGEPQPSSKGPPAKEVEPETPSPPPVPPLPTTPPTPEVDQAMPQKLQAFLRSQNSEARKEMLLDLYQLIQPQLQIARHFDRLTRRSQIGKALEKLFEDLYEFPEHINASSSSTLSQGLDILRALFSPARSGEGPALRPLMVLVVSDAPDCETAVIQPLEAAYIRTLRVDSPETARPLIEQNPFDLIFFHLDSEMIDYEMCEHVRAAKVNALTPTLWALPQEIYNIVPAAALVGANDIISTPLLTAELTLKVPALALRVL